jgi:RimJ/RimL family protein N-acetyltransferase
VLRSAETGSWLGSAFQGHGIGTRMRQAVCAFLFDVLGATQISSAAFVDNPASLAVSRKVGYRGDGTVRKNRQGTPVESRRLLLDPEAFVRGEPIEVTGAEPLRAFLGVL